MKNKTLWFITSAIIACSIIAACSGKQVDQGANADNNDSTAIAQLPDDTVYLGHFVSSYDGSTLNISKADDSTFNVKITIFRLTYLSDGKGKKTPDGLSFTATDANGKPIGGIVTVDGDTATTTFTNSTWPLIDIGTQFTFARQKLTEEMITKRVEEIYNAYINSDEDERTLDETYCSDEWQDIVEDVENNDLRNHQGEVGFFDWNYWTQAQDSGNMSVSNLKVTELTVDSATVEMILHNLGTKTPMQLRLIFEDGEWVIDDFINKSGDIFDWKKEMLKYLDEEKKNE